MDLVAWLWVWDERFCTLLFPFFKENMIPIHTYDRIIKVW